MSTAPVTVRFFGSPYSRYCGSCGGSRSQAEIASSLFSRLYRHFGDKVRCEFIDVERDNLSQFPTLAKLKEKGSLDLPIVMLNGEIHSSGHVYPIRLTHTIQQILGIRPAR